NPRPQVNRRGAMNAENRGLRLKKCCSNCLIFKDCTAMSTETLADSFSSALIAPLWFNRPDLLGCGSRIVPRRLGYGALTLIFLSLFPFQLLSQNVGTAVVVHSQPLHAGRINPMLFGNFVELLDDVVPAMWAEMLNNRSFEGVTRAANWSYYDGKPDFSDREWDTNSTWSYATENPFNGARSA